jgi:hypothetical protein
VPFAGPINVDPDFAALKAAQRGREVRCTCPGSPWCRGRDSADWLTCTRTCRSCNPRRRRPAVNIREGDDAAAD